MSSTMLKVYLVFLVCVGGFRVVMSSGGAHAAFVFNQVSASVGRVLLVEEATTVHSNVRRQLFYASSPSTAGSLHVLPAAAAAPSTSPGFSSQIIQAGYSAVTVQESASSSTPHINPSVLVIVVILSVVFILSGFLHLLARCLGRRGAVAAQGNSLSPQYESTVSALHGQLQHLFHLHDAGVEQAFIDSLPVFCYGSIRGLKDSADCAVCLNEFGEEDRLRLLPNCKHAFHLECIDTWLLSNSTCPLCRRSLLAEPAGSGDDQAGTSSSSAVGGSQGLCNPQTGASLELDQPVLRAPSFPRSSFRGSSLRESSFRIREEEEEDEFEIQVELDEMPSPMVPRVRVIDSNGMSTILTVELGKVKMDSSSKTATTTTAAGPSKRTLSPTRGIRRGGRSYSMGSYEYVVDPSNLELMIAPTPFPGRPQNWAPSKPTHRSALSDSIPELASAAGTPANDDLFWASRGLYMPRTLSTVRELLSPSPGRNAFSPAPVVDYGFGFSSPSSISYRVHDHHHRNWTGDINLDKNDANLDEEEEEEVRSEACAQETEVTADEAPSSRSQLYLEASSGRTLYFEAQSGRSLYFEAPSGSFYFEADDEFHSEVFSDSFRDEEEEELEEGSQSAVLASAATTTDSQSQSRGQSFQARIQAALRAQFLCAEAATACNVMKKHNNNNKDLARRSSSLSRLPEAKNSVSIYRRRSLSEISSSLQVDDAESWKNRHELWDCELQSEPFTAATQESKNLQEDEEKSTDHTISINLPSSTKSSKRYTLNWLMGRRNRRLVYSAATPPQQDLQQQQHQQPVGDHAAADCHLQIPATAASTAAASC